MKVLVARQYLRWDIPDNTVQEARAETKGSLNKMLITENSIRAHINKTMRKLKVEHPLSRQQLIEICRASISGYKNVRRSTKLNKLNDMLRESADQVLPSLKQNLNQSRDQPLKNLQQSTANSSNIRTANITQSSFNFMTRNRQVISQGRSANNNNNNRYFETNNNQSTTNRTKVSLEYDKEFQQDIQNCIKKLKRMPSLKKKMYQRIEEISQQMTENQGQLGFQAGMQARKRLRDRQREQEQKEERDLNKLIEETAKTNALQAINLNNLLRKKWNEQNQSYVVMSKIDNDKKIKKIRDYCFNRYIL
ncbi:UNKNOWN [Stylonychia lemnae]|uniref:Uncharacterized protein n=1 Tax=Stylonychia lemnae TaxID=5949 RepID=A0A078ANF6_STYLE|nr:UNKNOWN [Stylonychia lemnae]|eukprot:CDW83704.1 UNKNOWN [Stylonychia lemnae]